MRFLLCSLVLCVGCGGGGGSSGGTITDSPSPNNPLSIETNFTPGEQAEFFAVLPSGGTITTQEWSGLVAVFVEGVVDTGTESQDAFYLVDRLDSSFLLGVSPDSLRIGWSGGLFSSSKYITECITFVHGEGYVNAPYIPTFGSLDLEFYNEYWFIMDLGPTPRQITFTIGDSITDDNTGVIFIDLQNVIPQ